MQAASCNLFDRRLALLWVAIVALSLAAEARGVVIVEAGKPRATIVLRKADMAPGGKVATAAADLQLYVEKITGAKLAIVSDEEKTSGARILVGSSAATEALKVAIPTGRTAAGRDEGFVIVASGDNLVLAGNDTDPYHGTEYAVYEFLERQGVRWFMPGDYGELVPKRDTIRIDDVTIRQKPDFPLRSWWAHMLPEMQKLETRWKLRNKLNPDSNALFAMPGDSSVRALIPEKEYFKSNPEAFALNADGTRNQFLPNLSHPKAVELSAKTIKDALRRDPKLNSFGFAPDDGVPRDYSPETLLRNRGFPEVYGRPGVEAEKSISEEWIEFAINVTREVRKEFPNAYITTNAYANRNTPPQGVKLDDHMMIMFAALWSDTLHSYTNPKSWMAMREGQMLRTWAELCPNVWVYGYDETMLVSALTPVPRVSKVRVDLPLMKKWGVIGFLNEARNTWAEEGIATKYVRARLAWNADADVDAILTDFYSGWYGKAALPASKFWEALEATMRDTPMLGHEDRILPFVYTQELIDKLERFAAEAEKLADTDPTKMHVRADRLILEHLKGYREMQAAEFAGDFAKAARDGQHMMDVRKQLSAIDPFYLLDHEKRYHSGVYYWGVVERIDYYQKLADKLSGKTGLLVALLPEQAKFSLDPHDDGRFNEWFSPKFDDSAWRSIKTTVPYYHQGYMDEHGQIVLGNMWYRMTVDVPASFAGKPVTIRAPTVETEAWCWVNGQFVGYRPYREAYERPMDMEFDVTSAIKPGQKNTIAIRVSSGLNAAMAADGLLSRVFLYSPTKP